jgi:hypothetical protein
MSNATQAHNLYNLLSDAGAKGVSRSNVAKHLGVRESSVPIYFYGLRKFFSAEVENIKSGRKVVGYRLLNADSIDVPSQRRNSNPVAVVTKPIKATKTKVAKVGKKKTSVIQTTDAEVDFVDSDVAILDKNLDVEFSDSEFADIKATLGL